MKKPITILATLLSLLLAAGAAHAKIERPPQYIVFAFDGSKSVPMWNETRAFAKQMTAEGKPVKFTYFINAAYYLSDSYCGGYDAPGLGPGKSAIGFGGPVANVLERFKQTNLARTEQNEIANHAAGHFDGTKWTQLEWHSEFSQFYDIIFGIFKFNHVSEALASTMSKLWAFTKTDMIGFRAPQLGRNAEMYAELPQWGMRYDTSGTAAPNLWPKRNEHGTWTFPLAEIKVAGTSRKTLSMDYNFYYFQSKGLDDSANAKQYEEQMFHSYVDYFYGNYNGNRAPINIGHHFSKWNGGAYWEAEKRFIALVCGMPEVKCVTYAELLGAVEGMEKEKLLASYQAGDFEKTSFPRTQEIAELMNVEAFEGFLGVPSQDSVSDEDLLKADPPEAHDE